MESLTPYLKELIVQSALPLQSIEENFAVDSSGFSTTNYVRWFDVKYGSNEDWHDWIKMHLICGVKTHISLRALRSAGLQRTTVRSISHCWKRLLKQDSTCKKSQTTRAISA